jgi:hypothetical protein
MKFLYYLQLKGANIEFPNVKINFFLTRLYSGLEFFIKTH